jgi:probable F420-dependent oxidoreductase
VPVKIGIGMPTQGLMRRVGSFTEQASLPAAELDILGIARRAEQLGFDSLWFGDHTVMDRQLDPNHPSGGGQRSHPEGCVMLDAMTSMAMCAAVTTDIRIASSVLIAPYRHPLTVAHTFATMDQLSGGRIDMGVGPGWMRAEFDALGADLDHRFTVTEEDLQVYLAAWTEEWPSFSGTHYSFDGISVEPKCLQRPHVPMYYGAMTPAGARVAARWCQGLYPMLLSARSHASDHDHLVEQARREGDRIGRDLSGFRLFAFATGVISDGWTGVGVRPMLDGSAVQIVDDLVNLADHGYSEVTLYFDIQSGTMSEYLDVLDRFGAEVVGPAAHIPTTARF